MIQIQWTAPHIDEARPVIIELLQKKLIACANIFSHVESHFYWKDQLESSVEAKVLLKTEERHYAQIEALIKSHCSYEVPEILWMRIDGGNPAYLAWVAAAVKGSSEMA
jgi:periplasmic divalent cation tolerance protein